MGTFDFKQPDLSAFPASEREREIAAQYTRIRRIVIEGFPDAHTAWLVIDQQSFCITPQARDTAEHAAGLCWQLAVALLRMMKE